MRHLIAILAIVVGLTGCFLKSSSQDPIILPSDRLLWRIVCQDTLCSAVVRDEEGVIVAEKAIHDLNGFFAITPGYMVDIFQKCAIEAQSR